MNLVGIDVVAAILTGVVWLSLGMLTCLGLARISRRRRH
jgi:hypothetical protein